MVFIHFGDSGSYHVDCWYHWHWKASPTSSSGRGGWLGLGNCVCSSIEGGGSCPNMYSGPTVCDWFIRGNVVNDQGVQLHGSVGWMNHLWPGRLDYNAGLVIFWWRSRWRALLLLLFPVQSAGSSPRVPGESVYEHHTLVQNRGGVELPQVWVPYALSADSVRPIGGGRRVYRTSSVSCSSRHIGISFVVLVAVVNDLIVVGLALLVCIQEKSESGGRQLRFEAHGGTFGGCPLGVTFFDVHLCKLPHHSHCYVSPSSRVNWVVLLELFNVICYYVFCLYYELTLLPFAGYLLLFLDW